MKKMIFLICFYFLFSCSVLATSAEIVIDADTGRVLHGKNINTQHLIASTTKILTALVVLNNKDLKDKVTVGDEVLEAYGSAIYIKPTEKYTIEELLYGLMLRSGNDAALSLAIATAESLDGFVYLMNQTAQNIGMKNSVFNNPHGLDEKTENKSTVYDMAILMMHAMKSENFRKITSTTHYKFSSNDRVYDWYNKNKLLTDYKYATGGKIGYTKRAKHTFVSSATKDGKNLIVASFIDPNQFVTHKDLYEQYFSQYDKYLLIDKDNLEIKYRCHLYTDESFSMLLKKDEVNKVQREVVLFKKAINERNRLFVGNIYISLDNKVYKALKIYCDSPKKKESLLDRIKRRLKW